MSDFIYADLIAGTYRLNGVPCLDTDIFAQNTDEGGGSFVIDGSGLLCQIITTMGTNSCPVFTPACNTLIFNNYFTPAPGWKGTCTYTYFITGDDQFGNIIQFGYLNPNPAFLQQTLRFAPLPASNESAWVKNGTPGGPLVDGMLNSNAPNTCVFTVNTNAINWTLSTNGSPVAHGVGGGFASTGTSFGPPMDDGMGSHIYISFLEFETPDVIVAGSFSSGGRSMKPRSPLSGNPAMRGSVPNTRNMPRGPQSNFTTLQPASNPAFPNGLQPVGNNPPASPWANSPLQDVLAAQEASRWCR